LSGQASLGKKFYCSAFLKPMPNSSSFSRSLLTLMTFCLRLSVEFSFLIFVLLQVITVNKHQKSVFFNKNCKYLRPLLEVNKQAKFVRLCFNVLCFILALFSLQWFILLNRTRSLLFFTFEMESLLMGNYMFVKMNSNKISGQHSR
jgi:hypothetical protein